MRRAGRYSPARARVNSWRRRRAPGSHSASCSIEGEIAPNQDPVAEAARLQAQAQRAVDQFLGIAPTTTTSSTAAPSTPPRPTAASRPFNGTRRGPAPVTDSQLRFLDRLIRSTGTDLNAVLHHHQAGDLRDLTCKAAAGLIDELKALGARP